MFDFDAHTEAIDVSDDGGDVDAGVARCLIFFFEAGLINVYNGWHCIVYYIIPYIVSRYRYIQ